MIYITFLWKHCKDRLLFSYWLPVETKWRVIYFVLTIMSVGLISVRNGGGACCGRVLRGWSRHTLLYSVCSAALHRRMAMGQKGKWDHGMTEMVSGCMRKCAEEDINAQRSQVLAVLFAMRCKEGLYLYIVNRRRDYKHYKATISKTIYLKTYRFWTRRNRLRVFGFTLYACPHSPCWTIISRN